MGCILYVGSKIRNRQTIGVLLCHRRNAAERIFVYFLVIGNRKYSCLSTSQDNNRIRLGQLNLNVPMDILQKCGMCESKKYDNHESASASQWTR